MGVLVRIPTPLRRMTGGVNQVDLDVADLSQMIDRLESDYPGFKERLLDEEGELRYFVNIYVNGEEYPLRRWPQHRHQVRRRSQHSTGRSRRLNAG